MLDLLSTENTIHYWDRQSGSLLAYCEILARFPFSLKSMTKVVYLDIHEGQSNPEQKKNEQLTYEPMNDLNR